MDSRGNAQGVAALAVQQAGGLHLGALGTGLLTPALSSG